MPISITIEANNPEEVAAYLAMFHHPATAVLTDMGEVVARHVNGGPEPDEMVDTAAADEEPAEAAPSEDKPKRGRGRPRKVTQEADQATQTAPELSPEAAPVSEDNPFAEEAADAAPRDPSVDHGLALELLRGVYERPGGAAQAVNAILAEYGVAKFSNIPKAKGTELLTKARALDVEFPAA